MKTLVNFWVLILLMVLSFSLRAQSSFIIQNGESSQVFSTFQDAFDALIDGDTLYLPGGTFKIDNTIIDRKVTIIGAGHYPEYTHATGHTTLQGNLYFLSGSDYSMIQGVYLTGGIFMGNNSQNQNASHITISRCNLNNIKLYSGGNATAQHIWISENVIRTDINGGKAQHVLIEKNIVDNITNFDNNVVVSNNIIHKTSGDGLQTIFSCLFQNNIILHDASYFLYGSSSNTFLNNLFVKNISFSGSDYGLDNIVNQPVTSIFVNYEGGPFSYDHDFHLQETCPGHDAGNDGYDIGIYGTAIPYKEGAVPFNPHISMQQVSPTTDGEGNIQVEIHVSAQEH